jgi:hypothetical protein
LNALFEDAVSPRTNVLRYLHDIHLEPTHIAVQRLPMKGIPVNRSAGNRTSNPYGRRHLLCFLYRFAKPFREKRPEGSGRAFASGDVSARIRPITGRHSLSPSSHTRTAIGSPCGVPTQRWELYGFTTFRGTDWIGLGSLYTPAVLIVHGRRQ